MSSNIAVLKNLVDGMSQEQKIKVAKEGHHPLVPVYMVVDSLKKEQEMDKTLEELEAASNLPPAEETVRDRLVAAVSRPGGLRSLDSAEESEAIGPSYAGALPDMPGLGAGEAMPRSYTGPTWAPQMPTGTMTAARGGVVPGYANGGFYGQQEEEDFGFLDRSESDRRPFRFTPTPYGGESPSIGPPDPLGGPGALEHISPAGLPGFLLTKGKGVLGLGKAAWDFAKKIPGAQKAVDFAKNHPYIAAATSLPVAALGSAGYRSVTADPADDLDSSSSSSDSTETTYPRPILENILAWEAENSGGSTGIRQLADTSVSSGLRTDLHNEIKRLRSEYAELTPGQEDRAKYIQQQIQQLQGLAATRKGQLTARKDMFETTAAEDLASLEERYKTKTEAVDAITKKRIGQIERRLQPRIDRGVASLERSAADYDTDKRAAALLALSDTLGARNVDPRRSGFSSIGKAIGEFEDDELETATGMITNLRGIEDALEDGRIGYEDARLLAQERLDDSLFSGKRDMRDSLREGIYGYEDSLLDLTTGTQDAINTLNLGSIGDQISTELSGRALNDPLLTLMQDQLNNAERMELATQRAMDERTVAQIEASGQDIPTRQEAQSFLDHADRLEENARQDGWSDDAKEKAIEFRKIGDYWMNYYMRLAESAKPRPMDFRALIPSDSTNINSR